jgi:RHS repeat-associated protein
MMCAIQWKTTTQYTYEVGGKLKQVTLPDSSTVTYAYDALGNRIRKLSSSLDIHYQYSQGACRREIHKDPATQNILRTITYHPWGMSILANQTSTDYYFITDFRGWVWGLTDDSGTIVESYNYDPIGKILAGSLLSHARFLSGAHEGQWDAETGLYYLGARFYDPSLGRFIQEDAIEGSADHPASQNRYVYCQNDPVSLIDPTGYSPENTGTPARFNLSNLGNFGGASSTACILPDTSQYFARGDGIWWGDNSPSQGSMYCFDASGDYEVEEITGHTISDVVSGNDAGTTYYKMTINGQIVYVVQDKDGNLEAIASDTSSPTNVGMARGLNAAFAQMKKEGFDIKPDKTKQFLSSIASFAQQNLGTFASIHIQSRNSYWTYYQFMKHATIGRVIADVIKNDPYTGCEDKKRRK